MSDEEAYAAISAAAASISMAPPAYPLIFGGKPPRYYDRLNDRPGQKNGWYLAFHNPDGTTGGIVGSHKLQVSVKWITANRRTYTQQEKSQFAKEQAEKRLKAETERLRLQEQAAERAVRLWRRSKTADPAHPYLLRKNVGIHGIRQQGEALVIPLRKSTGQLRSLQFINHDGSKKFLYNGEITGCYHSIGSKPSETIILAEGYSTSATIFESTGHPTACAFNAGNLQPVAVAIRHKFPLTNIIIAADADPVGIRSAQAAAEAVKGSVVIPELEGGANG